MTCKVHAVGVGNLHSYCMPIWYTMDQGMMMSLFCMVVDVVGITLSLHFYGWLHIMALPILLVNIPIDNEFPGLYFSVNKEAVIIHSIYYVS